MSFVLEDVEIFANDAMYWVLLYATTLTGASWQDPQTHSGTEFDISATAVSGGIKIAGGYIAASNKGGISGAEIKHKFPFALDSAGTDQTRSLTIAVASTGGTNKSAAGIFNVEEIR